MLPSGSAVKAAREASFWQLLGGFITRIIKWGEKKAKRSPKAVGVPGRGLKMHGDALSVRGLVSEWSEGRVGPAGWELRANLGGLIPQNRPQPRLLLPQSPRWCYA